MLTSGRASEAPKASQTYTLNSKNRFCNKHCIDDGKSAGKCRSTCWISPVSGLSGDAHVLTKRLPVCCRATNSHFHGSFRSQVTLQHILKSAGGTDVHRQSRVSPGDLCFRVERFHRRHSAENRSTASRDKGRGASLQASRSFHSRLFFFAWRQIVHQEYCHLLFRVG